MTDTAYLKLRNAISRVLHGEMYYSEFVGYACLQFSGYTSQARLKKMLADQGLNLLVGNANRRLLKYFDGQRFDFKGVFLPDVRFGPSKLLMAGLSYQYNDLFKIHCEYAGDYSYTLVDPLDLRYSEGPYFYVGPNGENIILKSGDVVIDAGAWIGDFSALAAHLVGETGKVYAFEPSRQIAEWLKVTTSYYPNLISVPYGLGDLNQRIQFHDDQGGTGTFLNAGTNQDALCEIIRLDDWAQDNKITKVDFIKADIEGMERKMLMGAKRVLQDFGPTLSICTYHFPDDPEVLGRIILESNPSYKVIQRRHKLYAFVP